MEYLPKQLETLVQFLLATYDIKSWNYYGGDNHSTLTIKWCNKEESDENEISLQPCAYKKKSQKQCERDRQRMQKFKGIKEQQASELNQLTSISSTCDKIPSARNKNPTAECTAKPRKCDKCDSHGVMIHTQSSDHNIVSDKLKEETFKVKCWDCKTVFLNTTYQKWTRSMRKKSYKCRTCVNQDMFNFTLYFSESLICEKCYVDKHMSCDIVRTKLLFHLSNNKLHLLLQEIDVG